MYYGGGIQFGSDSRSTVKESESIVESETRLSLSHRQLSFARSPHHGNAKEKGTIEPTLFKPDIEYTQHESNGLGGDLLPTTLRESNNPEGAPFFG